MISLISKRLTRITTQMISNSSTAKTINNIDYEIHDGGLMKIVLNKPKALNSLNLQMIKDISSLLP